MTRKSFNGVEDTLDGLTEVEDRKPVKSNLARNLFGTVEDEESDVEETLDGLTEVEERKPAKPNLARNLFGIADDEESDVEETLDGLTEVEERKLNQKSSSIKLPPIRPFP